jgi:hypothetical protein
MYSLQEERVSWATGQQLGSDLASDPFPRNDRGIQIRIHRESRLTTEELLQAVVPPSVRVQISTQNHG